MWTPTHVVVTVLKARNLLDKGKGGNDAYCIIGLGKEKFLTTPKNKTLNPVWDEQAEFALTEREELKITIYHKSSLIDEFLGRALINIVELANENINSHQQWYKLHGKPEKEHKKPEKDRGELEVRIDFLVKPKSGSIADLSKTKDKSLSLKSLKDKSNSFKHSISDKLDKLKVLKRSGSSKKDKKYGGENQLADQSKRMGGSKLDFLDGDDYSSLTSSYSSINGASLKRVAEIKEQNRYSPRSSVIQSENSSINDKDVDLDDSISGHVVHQHEHTKPKIKTPAPPPPSTPKIAPTPQKEIGIDILPTKPDITATQPTSTSTPQSSRMRSILKKSEKTAPPPPPAAATPEPTTKSKRLPSTDSFASVFTASLGDAFKSKNKSESPSPPPEQPQPPKQQAPVKQLPPKPETTRQQAPTVPTTKVEASKKADTSFSASSQNGGGGGGNKSFTYDEEIDWASSDEEIINQQVAHFERNQTLTQSQRRRLMPTEDLLSDLDTDQNKYSNNKNSKRDLNNNNNKQQRNNLGFNFQQQQNSSRPKQQQQKTQQSDSDDEIKTPDIDIDFAFQEHEKRNGSKRSDDSSFKGSKTPVSNRNGLPDILQQQKGGSNKTNDKSKKFIDGLDGVPLSEVTVPEPLRKQLEYFDREELLQLIAYQKKFIDYKESRIKDLDNYIDNLVVKVIETNPTILMQAGQKLVTRYK